MRVYRIRGGPLLINASRDELLKSFDAWKSGDVDEEYDGDPPLEDACEQIRIILFAREMGWL